MSRISAAIVLSILALGITPGLAIQKNGPYTVEKSYHGAIAERVISSRTIPEVWEIAMKTLFRMKHMEIRGDKPSGTINARRPGAAITIIMGESGTDVSMSVKWEFMDGEKIQIRTPYKQALRFFDEFFPLLDEALIRMSVPNK